MGTAHAKLWQMDSSQPEDPTGPVKTGGGLRGNWTGGPHGGGSSITDLAFEEHAARARTGTRDRTTSGTASGRQGGRARRVLPKRTSCTQGHGYHRELQSPGPSKWRMGLPGSQAT